MDKHTTNMTNTNTYQFKPTINNTIINQPTKQLNT